MQEIFLFYMIYTYRFDTLQTRNIVMNSRISFLRVSSA